MAPRRIVAPARVALGLALALGSVNALAQNNSQLIETGRSQYENLQYEEAIQTLSAAIIRRGNNTQSEAAIYNLLALSYLALSRNDEAEGAFRLVLVRDPEYVVDRGLAPRVREFFEGVRRRWESEGRPGVARTAAQPQSLRSVSIEHRSPAEHTRQTALTLSATVVDPDRRASGLVLAWRAGSRGLFHRVNTQNTGGTFAATLPAAEVRPPFVEYYFEAVDESGIAVTARGDAFAPLRVVVPGESTSIVSRWWFWVGAAVLVAGAAVGTYFIVDAASEPPAAPRPATLTISFTDGN